MLTVLKKNVSLVASGLDWEAGNLASVPGSSAVWQRTAAQRLEDLSPQVEQVLII